MESSAFWDGISLGDAAGATNAPYSSLEYQIVLRDLMAAHNVSPWNRSALLPFVGSGNLAVTGVATPLAVAAGTAIVDGIWYQNDASLSAAVASPSVNPRIDRVVLRASWAAQTVRIALLAGAEAATPSPAALTQVSGTTWEVSLAQVYITVGGVITVRDERVGFMGLGPSVIFRDIANREYEEFFDHFNNPVVSANVPTGWNTTVVSSGSVAMNAAVPSSAGMTSGASANSSIRMAKGESTQYPHELAQAPLLFEARMTTLSSAADAQTTAVMRLINAAGTTYCQFGVIGSISAANLVLSIAAGGAAGNFTTGQAIDATATFHTLGIYVPASGGPVIAMYDRVAIGQVIANIPASGTDMRAEFFVGNGTTASARSINIDWARLVRGTA